MLIRLSICMFLALGACTSVSKGADADPGKADAPDNQDECIGAAADFIYVVDLDNRLLRFKPASNTFETIGTLSCPGAGATTPFSMSVGRDATAWVLYSEGQLYHVDTETAECTSTNFQSNQAGFLTFGMGFVSDSSGSQNETLFISKATGFGNSELGKIDKDSLAVTSIGNLNSSADYSPELTGTGAGELFGYYPGTFGSEVQNINKQNASAKASWDLDSVLDVTAWAFAHFGGKFYVFRSSSFSNDVYLFDPASGNETTVASNTPYTIVGAGVSTCVPFEPE